MSAETSERLRQLKLQRQKRLFHHVKNESDEEPTSPRTPKRPASATNGNSHHASASSGPSAKKLRKSTSNELGLPGPGDLKQNLYVERQRVRLSEEEIEELRCSCVQPGAWRPAGQPCCLEQVCFNRLVHIECVRGGCLALDDCQNQRFQRAQWARVQRFATNDGRGWGLRTLQALQAGQLVIEYCGEVVSRQLCAERLRAMGERRETNFYFLSLDGDECIDARTKGNNARYINHSCNPNCETQKWQVAGEQRVGIFALRDVPPNTELTFDYQFERFGSEKQRCLCKEPNCRGFLGEKPRPLPPGAVDKLRAAERKAALPRRRGAEVVAPQEHLSMLELLRQSFSSAAGASPSAPAASAAASGGASAAAAARAPRRLHARLSLGVVRHGYRTAGSSSSSSSSAAAAAALVAAAAAAARSGAGAGPVRPVRTHLSRNVSRIRKVWMRIFDKFSDRFS